MDCTMTNGARRCTESIYECMNCGFEKSVYKERMEMLKTEALVRNQRGLWFLYVGDPGKLDEYEKEGLITRDGSGTDSEADG